MAQIDAVYQNKVCIVVVTYNNVDCISRCIKAILSSDCIFSIEIVVVDNCSSDNTLAELDKFIDKIKVIKLDKNLGFGRANNIAFKEVCSDYYILVNSDAYLNNRSISDIITLMMHDKSIGILGIPLVFPDLKPQTSSYSNLSIKKKILQALGLRDWIIKLLNARYVSGIFRKSATAFGASEFVRTYAGTEQGIKSKEPLVNEALEVDWVCGAVMAISSHALKATGGFDERIFLYYEDEDLCLRAKKSGFNIKIGLIQPVIHDFGWGKSINKANIINIERKKSAMYFVKKHFSNRPIIKMIFLLLIRIKPSIW